MSDDIGDIAAWYDSTVAEEDARLEMHQLEFDLTWRYLQQYLPPCGPILEIGAGPGRYTLALCRQGYQVTAVDLSPALLRRCRDRLTEAGLADHLQCIAADARDLHAVPGDFSAVLLMGPLYHLVSTQDRQQAVREAVDRLQPGGLFVSTHLSRLGVLGDLLKKSPEWIAQEEAVRFHMDQGRRPDAAPRGGFRGYFARVGEVRPLHEAFGIQTLILAGIEPAVGAEDGLYGSLPAPLREEWLNLLFEISTDETIVGASRHILYIGRKGVGPA